MLKLNSAISIGIIIRQLKSLSKRKAFEIIALAHIRKKITVSDIAKALDIPSSTAKKYLEELVSVNLLGKK